MVARALSSGHLASWLETPGRYSLGLFALHPFFMTLLAGVLPMSVIAWAGGEIDLRFVFAFAVVASTSIAVALLAQTPLRPFVTTERSPARETRDLAPDKQQAGSA